MPHQETFAPVVRRPHARSGRVNVATMLETFGPVGQVGYVVNDLEAAARAWFESTGIGPWRVWQSVPLDHFTYEGVDSPVDFGMATAYSGPIQIELIAQHNDAPSMYREMRDTMGQGVQHLCFYPADYDAAMAQALANGLTVGQEGSLAGIRFAYLRGPSGMVVELGDIPDSLREARLRQIEAAKEWDGADPIRLR